MVIRHDAGHLSPNEEAQGELTGRQRTDGLRQGRGNRGEGRGRTDRITATPSTLHIDVHILSVQVRVKMAHNLTGRRVVT